MLYTLKEMDAECEKAYDRGYDKGYNCGYCHGEEDQKH